MKSRFIVLSVFTAALVSTAGPLVTSANDMVEIRFRGRYYAEPATVQLTIAVEPNAENRKLMVEAESAEMYRSSEISLNGAGAERIHMLEFKNLMAGDYVVSAQVFSSTGMKAMATQELTVNGTGGR